jgi:hypothetical protein
MVACPSLIYKLAIPPVLSNFETTGQTDQAARGPITNRINHVDIAIMREKVERCCDPVENVDVLIELSHLNSRALKVFTSARRGGASEVSALVQAIWSLKKDNRTWR